ncbi:hypothetical protein MTO96_010119 [Rhipicephalus appendiculatus]
MFPNSVRPQLGAAARVAKLMEIPQIKLMFSDSASRALPPRRRRRRVRSAVLVTRCSKLETRRRSCLLKDPGSQRVARFSASVHLFREPEERTEERWFSHPWHAVRGFKASMEQNAVMSETAGQVGVGGHEKAERVAGDKAFMMRDGAVCGDIAEINKPCVELLGEASERAVPVATAEQGTSPDAEQEEYTVEEDDDVSYVESDENSLADDSSYQAVDGYYSHKFLQDLLARMASEPHPLSNEAQEAKRELLDPALVETYTAHATRVYESYLRHIDALGVTVSKRLEDIRDKALGLDLPRRIQVQLYSDTVEAAVSHLRRVAMTWGSLVLLDMSEPSRTVPRGMSEQYLFCRIVSACLKLRDTWWRSEFYLAKYFLRFLNRCQGLSDDWQSRLQEANVSVLRGSIEAHERMDREIGLWQWARTLRFPSEHRPDALQPNLLSVFVDEQLTGDVSSLMTLFVFETGNTVYRAIFSIPERGSNFTTAKCLGADLQLCSEHFTTSFKNPSDLSKLVCVMLDACHMVKRIRNSLATFERRQLSYDSSELETEVRGTWAAYLESVHEQCASIGANRALYSMSLHQGEDAARIGDGARFYMDMVTPLHKAVTLEWSKTYSALIEQLAQTAQAEPDRKADLDQVAAWVDETGRQVSDAMQTAAQIRKILE